MGGKLAAGQRQRGSSRKRLGGDELSGQEVLLGGQLAEYRASSAIFVGKCGPIGWVAL